MPDIAKYPSSRIDKKIGSVATNESTQMMLGCRDSNFDPKNVSASGSNGHEIFKMHGIRVFSADLLTTGNAWSGKPVS